MRATRRRACSNAGGRAGARLDHVLLRGPGADRPRRPGARRAAHLASPARRPDRPRRSRAPAGVPHAYGEESNVPIVLQHLRLDTPRATRSSPRSPTGSERPPRVEGQLGAPAVVLSNALGTNGALWDAQVPALGALPRRPVRAPSACDRWRSSARRPRPGGHSRRRALSFCGLTWAGWSGCGSPRAHRTRLNRLVLVSTAARRTSPRVERQGRARAHRRDGGRRRRRARQVVHPGLREPRAVPAMQLASTPEDYALGLEAIGGFDFRGVSEESGRRRWWWSAPETSPPRRTTARSQTASRRLGSSSSSEPRICRTSSSRPRSTVHYSSTSDLPDPRSTSPVGAVAPRSSVSGPSEWWPARKARMRSACCSSARRRARARPRGLPPRRASAVRHGLADELARPADLVEELDGLPARHHRVGVPLDVELDVEGEDRVEQRERALGGQGPCCSSGSPPVDSVEGVAEEEHPVLFTYITVLSAAWSPPTCRTWTVAPPSSRSSPSSKRVSARATRTFRGAGISSLMFAACWLRSPAFDPRVERLVAPVGRGKLGQGEVSQPVRDHGGAHLGGAEDVIPVGVREHTAIDGATPSAASASRKRRACAPRHRRRASEWRARRRRRTATADQGFAGGSQYTWSLILCSPDTTTS